MGGVFYATLPEAHAGLTPSDRLYPDTPEAVTGATASSSHGEGNVNAFVKQKYNGCRILDKDYDDGVLEVKIRHRGIEKIVLFDGGRWLRTLWETRRERLPKNIIAALNKAGFAYSHIDDNDNYVVENREGRFYAVQTQRSDRVDLYYILSDKGRILHRYSDDRWDDGRMHGHESWDEDSEWDDGEDHFDEGDDEWDDRKGRGRYRGEDDGEDHFDEGDDEWDD